MKRSVSIIGLGAMGTALATTFLEKGVQTVVWNRSPEKAAALVEKGAVMALSVSDAVQAATLVVICLLDYDTVYTALAPAENQLNGRLLVNLTNGTPAQAKAMGQWAAKYGAGYLDGGIMAIPPMIGQREALILYSGSAEGYATWQSMLDILGTSRFLGKDAGAAALYDISLLTGMYGMFTGALQAVSMIAAAKMPAREFVSLLIPWVNAMMGALPGFAELVDTGKREGAVSSALGMQSAAYVNLIRASEELGVSKELVLPLQQLMERGVKKLGGDVDFWDLHCLLRSDI